MKSHRIALAATGFLTSGCIEGTAPDEVGRASAALTPVTWTDTVRVSAVGNDLTKTAPQTAWNAGAVSVQSLAGDGYVEFTTGEATTDKMAGLSVGNGGQGYQDIDFAIRLGATGAASVWEGGTRRAGMGAYAAGDVFRVQAEDGVVTYYKNGALEYTSALAPSFPLRVDTSLRTTGATVNDVVLESLDVWTAAVRVAVDGGDITKTAPEDLFNAGAVSTESIPGGEGYVEFRVADSTTVKAAGLSNGNGNASRDDIDFALSLSEIGKVSIYEAGTRIGTFGDYAAGDRFQVGVSGGVVTYYRNWVPLYTSLASPSFPLLLDTSIKTPGAQILDGRVVAGAPVPECAPFQASLPGPGGAPASIDAALDVMVVGYPDATPPVTEVYRQSAAGWELEQTLERPADAGLPRFGLRVATDGQTIAVLMFDVVQRRGAIQLYRFDGSEWNPDGRFEGCPADEYGMYAAAVQGDVLVVSGGVYVFPETPAGRAFVYRRTGGVWNLDGIVTPADGECCNDSFGALLAVGGDRVFVFASGAGPGDDGAVYVYRYNAALPDPEQPPSCSNIDQGKWRQRDQILLPPPPHEFNATGVEIDASPDGRRLLVGDEDLDSHLYTFANGNWVETIFNPFRGGDGRFVAFGGPAPRHDSLIVASGFPHTYLFAEHDGGWRQIASLGLPGRAALSNDSLLRPTSTGVDVYGIDPACLTD